MSLRPRPPPAARASAVIAEWSDLRDRGRRRIAVRRREHGIEEREAERRQPDRGNGASEVRRRDTTDRKTGAGRDSRDDDRWQRPDRRREADEPDDRDNELQDRAGAPEDAVELRRPEVARDDHAATFQTSVSLMIRPPSSSTTRDAISPRTAGRASPQRGRRRRPTALEGFSSRPSYPNRSWPNVGSSRTSSPGRRTSVQASERRRASPPLSRYGLRAPKPVERQAQPRHQPGRGRSFGWFEAEHDLVLDAVGQEARLPDPERRIRRDERGRSPAALPGHGRPAGSGHDAAAGDRPEAGRASICRSHSRRRARRVRHDRAPDRSTRGRDCPARIRSRPATRPRRTSPRGYPAANGANALAGRDEGRRRWQPDPGFGHPLRGANQDVVRSADVDRRAIRSEREDDVGELPRRVHVMLDEDDGGRPLGSERPKAIEEGGCARRIEVRRRLIEDDDLGPRRKDAGQGQPLLLTAGQPVRPAALEAGETGLGDGLRDPRCHRLARPGPVLESECDLVLDPLHDQLGTGILEDEADATGDLAAGRDPRVQAGHGHITPRQCPGCRAGSGRRERDRASSCRTPTHRQRAGTPRPARRTRAGEPPAYLRLGRRSRGRERESLRSSGGEPVQHAGPTQRAIQAGWIRRPRSPPRR